MAAMNSIADLRARARRRLPSMVFDFVDGAALDELTMNRNRAAFDRLLLSQRVLLDVKDRSLATSVLGSDLDLPLVVSPMGLLTVCHPGADVALAKAAARAGSIFIHSPWSACSLEEVAAAAPGRVWAQVSFWTDAAETDRHIDRARAAGVDTLVIAGDVGVSSKRDRDLRHGAGIPPRLGLADTVSFALHPGWVLRLATGRRLTYGNWTIEGRALRPSEMKSWMAANENPAASWDAVAELRRRWPGRILVKGVMTQQDARLSRDHGLDGVFISNHGGRQSDSQPATIEALPRIVEEVGEDFPVILDGGIRRGSDIVKALALGACAAAAGRPFAWGLAAGGQAGAEKAFEILADEFSTALGFVGGNRVGDLGPGSLSAGVTIA